MTDENQLFSQYILDITSTYAAQSQNLARNQLRMPAKLRFLCIILLIFSMAGFLTGTMLFPKLIELAPMYGMTFFVCLILLCLI
jgi:hypothetical protein